MSHAGDFWLQQGLEPNGASFLGVTVGLTGSGFMICSDGDGAGRTFATRRGGAGALVRGRHHWTHTHRSTLSRAKGGSATLLSFGSVRFLPDAVSLLRRIH